MSQHDHEVTRASTTPGLPVSPSLGPTLEAMQVPTSIPIIDRRVVSICLIATIVGVIAALCAQVLILLIAAITNISFFGRISTAHATPADHQLGLWVIGVPIIGAVVIGLMARFGSKGIRGHGIPEAMEQVLTNQSRIPARMTLLKPLSAAISIGTGGPFGAEGPIIASGGALGSLIGQLLHINATERKTLLAAGAAAGLSATFGAPIAAVMLAIELLLFEFRPRSFIPVAFACVAATVVRLWIEGSEPMFHMTPLATPPGSAIAAYVMIGLLMGVFAVVVTRTVHAVEDLFAKLPIHWMWWPAIGAVAVGIVGYFAPNTFGVGYSLISDLLSGKLAMTAIAFLCVMKFISWSIMLGSGTSGGTLAPVFIIGGCLGSLCGSAINIILPAAQVDIRVAALVGMAALFAGASRALLTAIILAFETTLQPHSILPLLGACTASYLVATLLMRQSIMTETISRRGVRVPAEYAADVLEQILVRDVASQDVKLLRGDDTLQHVRDWLLNDQKHTNHQGFPVVNERGMLLGVLTRRDMFSDEHTPRSLVRELIRRPPCIVYDDCSLREAVDHMANHNIGRLPVVTRDEPGLVTGIITRSDILSAYRRRIDESKRERSKIRFTRRQRDGAD